MTSRNIARLIFLIVLIGLSAAFLMQVSSNQVPRFENADKVVHFVAFFCVGVDVSSCFPDTNLGGVDCPYLIRCRH